MVDAAPSPFSPNIPSWQIAWDSTSLGWAKECWTLYRYFMLEGWSPRSKGIHLAFGGWYASGVERYAHARATGLSHDEAEVKMVRWVLENSGTRSEDGSWTPWSPPADHKDANIKNRYTLIRSLVWNCEDRLGSPFKTVILANGKPAVELSFNFAFTEIEGESISLAGHMDELCEADGVYYVKDDKTTKSPLSAHYFQQWSPNNQMSLYSIAGRIILDKPVRGVLVRAAQIGVEFTRFATAQVPRPQAVLAEWLEDAKFYIRQARENALTGHFPRNDKSCGNYGGCVFQKVCSVSPSHRQAWLEQDFEKRIWNPLDARGDI